MLEENAASAEAIAQLMSAEVVSVAPGNPWPIGSVYWRRHNELHARRLANAR